MSGPTLAEVQRKLGRDGWLRLDVYRPWPSDRPTVDAEWRIVPDDPGAGAEVRAGTFDSIDAAIRAVCGGGAE